MKCRVDSKELKSATVAVAKFASAVQDSITKMAMLTVDGDALYLRSTTYGTNTKVRINAFDCEPGVCFVSASHLQSATYDSGDFVELRTTSASLMMDYGNSKIRLSLQETDENEFPKWWDGERIVCVDKNALRSVLNFAGGEKSGRGAIVVSTHFIPYKGKYAIVCTDGISGAMIETQDEVENAEYFALDAKYLQSMSSLLWDTVCVGRELSVINLSSGDCPVSFTLTETAVPKGFEQIVDQMFVVTGKYVATFPQDAIEEIRRLARISSNIDDTSQILIDGENGIMEIRAEGTGISIRSNSEYDGEIKRIAFMSKLIASALGDMIKAETYTVHFFEVEEKAVRILLLCENGKYVISACSGGRFESV